jgi:hypothetical protein
MPYGLLGFAYHTLPIGPGISRPPAWHHPRIVVEKSDFSSKKRDALACVLGFA